LSVDAVHVSVICVLEFAVAARFVGAEGAVLSDDAAIVTVAVAVFDVSACAVAVTVTAAGFGTLAGAVYKPLAEIVPCVASPETCHVTVPFVAFVTVAENCCVCPVLTLAVVGETATLTALFVVEELAPHPCSRNSSGTTAMTSEFRREHKPATHSSSKSWASLKMNAPNYFYEQLVNCARGKAAAGKPPFNHCNKNNTVSFNSLS
jgi:hypothetical protein